MKVLLVDNYDSFTFNLYHLLESMTDMVTVLRNDELDFKDINSFDKIILSPGPGLPSESGQLMPLIKEFYSTKSILGICLGHQAIAEVFGSKLLNMSDVRHGIKSNLDYIDSTELLFNGIYKNAAVGHYHSWVVDPKTISDELKVTSKSNDLIMSISHNFYDVKGLQFHPESILTPQGGTIIQNWIDS
ncbi:MAG: aminodeoxychorismate/anthranilate synthase component II [Flavobacteriales bacterium]|nr:aminodeoxychorismate/anthranilate synthase component II [Flavobacteriales bacterium]